MFHQSLYLDFQQLYLVFQINRFEFSVTIYLAVVLLPFAGNPSTMINLFFTITHSFIKYSYFKIS